MKVKYIYKDSNYFEFGKIYTIEKIEYGIFDDFIFFEETNNDICHTVTEK